MLILCIYRLHINILILFLTSDWESLIRPFDRSAKLDGTTWLSSCTCTCSCCRLVFSSDALNWTDRTDNEFKTLYLKLFKIPYLIQLVCHYFSILGRALLVLSWRGSHGLWRFAFLKLNFVVSKIFFESNLIILMSCEYICSYRCLLQKNLTLLIPRGEVFYWAKITNFIWILILYYQFMGICL